LRHLPRHSHRSTGPLGLVIGLLLLLASLCAQAQTCALPGWDGPVTGSGVLNAYHGGSGSPAAGATSITVASATGLRTNTRALRAGDLILIMQMQDSSSATNAGLYEYAQVTAITGTTVSLNRPLTNSYAQSMSTSAVRNWQAVWVPQYSAATISGTVSADPWTSNTTTGVVSGGVVALDVAGSLTLSGTVTAAGSGFRGAYGLSGGNSFATGTATTPNSTFTPTAVYGGQKGEGIQGTPPVVFQGNNTQATYSTLLGQGYAAGAGGQQAIANAGGAANDGSPATGGNQYNAGGGGGGNAGAGGQGGNSWNSGGLQADLNQNQTATQTGNIAGGKGGNAQTNAATRLVMGGGGGSGSANNATVGDTVTNWPPTASSVAANGASGPVTSSGSSGGGTVLIRAGTLTGTGVVDVSGYRAFNKNPVGDTDAAGGGGAGGSIFFTTASGTGSAVTLRAPGGEGGSSNYYNHGPGGGGGGGFILTNFTGATTNVLGAASGTDACCGGTTGNGSPKAWNSVAGSNGTVATTGGSSTGVQGGGLCLPAINVTKSTLTPTVTSATGATASYSVNLSNSGGAASNVFILDATLPPGWAYTAATAPVYAYSPAPPPAANSNASGAESTSAAAPGALPASSVTTANSATAVTLRAAGAAPGVVPATGNNTATFGSFYLPQNGSITVTFVATIPDTATAGTYHNPAGVIFLDPTRSTTAVRMVTPLTNATANRAAIGYSGNTAYASGATANVGGSNYSGLQAGPTTEDVRLLPDLSVTKTLNTTTLTVGAAGQQYVIVGRNNGRAVADQVYATTQATGQSATSIVSSAPAITDTLPAGLTLTAVTNSAPAIWTCAPNGTSTTFTCSASTAVYPMAAATNLVTVTATVAVSTGACPGPQTNTATITISALGDAVPANNTATVASPAGCGANLTVGKTDGVTAVTAGGTTAYTVTFANVGPAASDGTTVADTPGAGLSCTVTNCSASGTGVCPAAGLWPNLLSGGLQLASFASGATVSFVVSCDVTATGQ
jgi:uncharacterized repeat protein (TIGR01451 family)